MNLIIVYTYKDLPPYISPTIARVTIERRQETPVKCAPTKLR